MKPIVTGSLVALTAVSLTANVLLYMRYSTGRPLVTVGSQVISKKDYQDALDYKTQGAVLKSLVMSDLINQAAAREGVTPTAADINARLAEIQRADPSVLAGTNDDPAKLAAIKDDLKTRLALDNLRIKDVHVTDAEVSDFYNRNKKSFMLPTQVRTTIVVAQNAVDASEAAALLKQDISVDVIGRQPRLHVVGKDGFNPDLSHLPPTVNATVFRMKSGDVQTVPVKTQAGTAYLVVRANQQSQAGVPPLPQIKPEVTRQAELAKAVTPQVEMARLYQAAKPQFNVAKYETYFSDLGNANVADAGKKTASAE